jgi:hypothetical protein
MDLEGLVALLESGDLGKVVDGLSGLSDAERKQLGPKVRGWIPTGSRWRGWPSRPVPGRPRPR